ncbi:MAG: hypothetical protein JOZ96_05475 [Acidobacteria bacterium]|nr:hypothetical protein [Acidobacteriota bacterium]
MNNWMRRRIERSRARCEKAAANHKTDKDQEAEKRPDGEALPNASRTGTA